ncbi:hypothetical protein THAOC_33392, partial [Thalassiosira oceanica]
SPNVPIVRPRQPRQPDRREEAVAAVSGELSSCLLSGTLNWILRFVLSLVRPELARGRAGRVKQGEVGEVAPTGGRPRPRRAEETDVSLGRRVEERGLKRRKAMTTASCQWLPAITIKTSMAAQIDGTADADTVVTETTCAICLEDPKDPRNLPCGHSFCDGCLNEWRSRYGVQEEMRRKCPICRARIPPSKEMVSSLLTYRAAKQMLEDNGETSSERYHRACRDIARAEEDIGADWDGVTVLEMTGSRQLSCLTTFTTQRYGETSNQFSNGSMPIERKIG